MNNYSIQIRVLMNAAYTYLGYLDSMDIEHHYTNKSDLFATDKAGFYLVFVKHTKSGCEHKRIYLGKDLDSSLETIKTKPHEK